MFLTQFNTSERFFEKTKKFCEWIRAPSHPPIKTKAPPPPTRLHHRTNYVCRGAKPYQPPHAKVKQLYIYLL
jgi:hypothetical protein